MADVTGVSLTSSRNLNYKYLSYAELVKQLRSAMVKYGLTVHPTDVVIENQGTYATSRGAEMRTVTLSVQYRFQISDEEYDDVEVVVEAADTSDKACSKAMTQAMKYAMRQYFLIETDEDDPDTDRHDRSASARKLRLEQAIRSTETVEGLESLMRVADDHSVATFTPAQREQLSAQFKERMAYLEAQGTPREGTDTAEKEGS